MGEAREYSDRLSRIEDYLKSQFGECSIHMDKETVPSGTLFRVHGPDGRVRHLLEVSEEFVSDYTPDEIQERLEFWDTKRVMEEAGRKIVRVTKSGLTVVERD